MQTSIRLLSSLDSRRGARRAAALMTALVLGVLPFSACTRPQQDNSSSFLMIAEMTAASGADPSKFGNFLQSDVVTCVDSPGNIDPLDSCPDDKAESVYEDAGKVEFALGMKDPGTPTTPSKPTSANFITVTNYHVEFVRVAGFAGAVPAAFDGAANATVTGVGGGVAFVLVPAGAKGALSFAEVQSIATITFFGKDQAGRAVQGTATISVNFGNWGDPK